MQDRVGTPSICTVQAPHSPAPQPNFVPGHLHHVAQCPEQRHVRIGIDRADAAINSQINHRRCSRFCGNG